MNQGQWGDYFRYLIMFQTTDVFLNLCWKSMPNVLVSSSATVGLDSFCWLFMVLGIVISVIGYFF